MKGLKLLALILVCNFVKGHNHAWTQSAERAEEYIWNQRDPETGFWPRDEVANAIMGVGARNTNLKDGWLKSSPKNESETILRNMERVHASFLMEIIRSVGEEMVENNDPKDALTNLATMEEQFILTLVGALKMTCIQDPRNYFGYNLLDVLWRKLLEQHKEIDGRYQTYTPSLSYPAILLAMCVNDDFRMISNTTERGEVLVPLFGQTLVENQFTPLGVERASMNVLAATCILEHISEDFETNILVQASRQNLKYIYSMQESDGGFKTIHATSMAITAELSRHSPPEDVTPMNVTKARNWLINNQNADGSFGSSVTFTSLALASLLDRSSKYLTDLNCENFWKRPNDEFEIKISIEDTFYAKQTYHDRIPAKRGDHLDDILKAHAKSNPTSLKLITENRLSRVVVTSINELENHDDLNYEWFVFKVQDDNLKIDADKVELLRGINVPVEEGYTYKFIYQ